VGKERVCTGVGAADEDENFLLSPRKFLLFDAGLATVGLSRILPLDV
jgi:hypothetical protein